MKDSKNSFPGEHFIDFMRRLRIAMGGPISDVLAARTKQGGFTAAWSFDGWEFCMEARPSDHPSLHTPERLESKARAINRATVVHLDDEGTDAT